MLRDKFHMPKRPGGHGECIYLTGHSLGPCPKSVIETINHEVSIWQDHGERGQFDDPQIKHIPWTKAADQEEGLLGVLINLVGAESADEIALSLSLTADLHLMFASFYKPTKERYKILVEEQAFPSGLFALESQIELHQLNVKDALLKAPNDVGHLTEAFVKAIAEHGPEIALVWLPAVQYLTGEVVDMQSVAQVARRHEIPVIGADLAHAIGNIPMSLHFWDIDMAVWCSYKYLCGGPGAIGGFFVHSKHTSSQSSFNDEGFKPALRGWWGCDPAKRFSSSTFQPANGAKRFCLSNPDVLSLVALKAALSSTFALVPIEQVWRVSYSNVQHFIANRPLAVEIVTPSDRHGAQVSFKIRKPLISPDDHDGNGNDFMQGDEAQKVAEKLWDQHGIVVDVRQDGIIRASFSGLYCNLGDVQALTHALAQMKPGSGSESA